MQTHSNCSRETEFFNVGLCCISSEVKQFILWFFKTGSGNAVYSQPMCIALNNEARTVTFVSVQKFQKVFANFFVR